ncbi:MAG: hypothetical protein ACR2P3_08385 [Geminicoccaceae bacterium]
MRFRSLALIILLVSLESVLAIAEQSDISERVLNNRLNNLESQAIQRQGRERNIIDLLKRQDDKIAGQALNALKTRSPRHTAVPLLERKLFRSRRPAGRFTSR